MYMYWFNCGNLYVYMGIYLTYVLFMFLVFVIHATY